MSRLSQVLALLTSGALALTASPVSAAPPKPGTYAIILGGGKAPDDAKRVLGSFSAPEWLTPPKGYPRTFESKTLPGLNPGFHIVVLGFCEDKATASELTRRLNETMTGVYFKQTEDARPGLCPEMAEGPEGYTLDQETPVAQKGPEAKRRWVLYKSVPTPNLPKDECEVPGWLIQVKEGAKVLAEKQLDTSCRKPSPDAEGDYGDSTAWKVTTLELSGVTVLSATKSASAADNTQHSEYLYGFGCGRIVEKSLGSYLEFGGGSGSVETATSDDGKPVVRVTSTEHPGDPEPLVMDYTWSAKACDFQ